MGNLGVLMLQHLRAVLLATGVLVVGTVHTLSAASATPVPAKASFRTEPERLSSAAVSSMAGASLRAVSICF